MLNPARIPHRIRKTVSTLFHKFGIHCATHQKRVILISCVVITSLFYPALALYSTSNPLSHLSSHFFDGYQSDLRELWENHEALDVREDAAARARCGMESTLRIERVLIPSLERTTPGAAVPSALNFALQLEDRIRSVISGADSPLSCVRTHENQCFYLSPALFFSRGVPSTPSEILNVINSKHNITVADIPVEPYMLLSTRSPMNGHHHATVEHVDFLALTYFFHDSDCLAVEGHDKWMDALAKLSADDWGLTSVTPFVLQKPRFIALQYSPTSSRHSHFSAISLFLYLSYLIIFLSFSGSLRRMDTVHSRFGLTFTGIIEIIASTIASVSVCALAGFRVTMVPWGILPVIIVFVGAENMFILVDAVTSTSITLPVKERIGTGLAVAGTSNTLKTVTYNSILGTIAFFSTGAIQQFCSFAIVLLVAHWFLIHTFFIAVLSIDLQRLELSDVLSQDKASKPNVRPEIPKETPPSKRRRAMSKMQQILRGRAAKNGSLVMMLAVTATLYYVTYPHPSRPKDDMDAFPFLTPATAAKGPARSPHEMHAPAWDIWNILNPDHDHLVHIRIETPMVITLNLKESGSDARRQRTDGRHNYEPMTRRSMSFMWLLKIMILPIGTTTGCLYLLLLYLLKDAELLEAQRNKLDGPSNLATPSVLPVDVGAKFTTLPRTFATDVELIAANHDASLIALVSTENELFLWNGQYHQINVSEVFSRCPSGSDACPSIVDLAVEHYGRYCAIGTNSGAVAVWRLAPSGSSEAVRSFNIASFSSVTDIAFISTGSQDMQEFVTTSSENPLPRIDLLVVYDDGSAAVVNCLDDSASRTIQPSRPGEVLQSRIVPSLKGSKTCVAFTYSDGTVELCSRGDDAGAWKVSSTLQAGSPADPVTDLCHQVVNIDGIPTSILGTSTRAGVVSLWNLNQVECIFVMADAFGNVTRLRIFPMLSQPCNKCGELTPDGFSLSYSVDQVVFVYRALVRSMSKRCACAVSPTIFPKEVNHHRSRSGSSSSATTSSSRSRLKVPSARGSESSGMPSFPISGHGVHIRRTSSEKDSIRRLSDAMSGINTHKDDVEVPSMRSSSRVSPSISILVNDSIWRGLVVEQIASINCGRGGWDLIDSQLLIGLRKRYRPGQNGVQRTKRTITEPSARDGLTESVLERWELWTFNLTKPEAGLRASSLLEVSSTSNPPPASENRSVHPRLPFTRISPVVVRPSACVAGLGNTAGVVSFASRSRPL